MDIHEQHRAKQLAASGYDPAIYDYNQRGEIFRKPVVAPPAPPAPEATSAAGAFGRSAVESIVPTAGGLGGAALALNVLTLPLKAHPIGLLASVVGTGIAGALAGGAAQNKVLEAVVGEEVRAGQLQKLQQAREEHPYASLAGEFLPSLGAFSPRAGLRVAGMAGGALKKAVGGRATGAELNALEKAALINTGAGAGISGAVEAGMQLGFEGEISNPLRVLGATALGAVLNEPNMLGRAMGFKSSLPEVEVAGKAADPAAPKDTPPAEDPTVPPAEPAAEPAATAGQPATQQPAPKPYNLKPAPDISHAELLANQQTRIAEATAVINNPNASNRARSVAFSKISNARGLIKSIEKHDMGSSVADVPADANATAAKRSAAASDASDAPKQHAVDPPAAVVGRAELPVSAGAEVRKAPSNNRAARRAREPQKPVSSEVAKARLAKGSYLSGSDTDSIVDISSLKQEPVDPLPARDQADQISDEFDDTGRFRYQLSSELVERTRALLRSVGRHESLWHPSNKDWLDDLIKLNEERGVGPIATSEKITQAGAFDTVTQSVTLGRNAKVDTGFHELVHLVNQDIQSGLGNKVQESNLGKALALSEEHAARLSEEQGLTGKDAITPEEVFTEAVGVSVVERAVINREGTVAQKISLAAKDVKTFVKRLLGLENLDDLIRLHGQLLLDNRPRAEIVADRMANKPQGAFAKGEAARLEKLIDEAVAASRAVEEVVGGPARSEPTLSQRTMAEQLEAKEQAARVSGEPDSDVRYQNLSPLGDNPLFETQFAKHMRVGSGKFKAEGKGPREGQFLRSKLHAAIFGSKSGYSKGEQDVLRLLGLEKELSQKGFVSRDVLESYTGTDKLDIKVISYKESVASKPGPDVRRGAERVAREVLKPLLESGEIGAVTVSNEGHISFNTEMGKSTVLMPSSGSARYLTRNRGQLATKLVMALDADGFLARDPYFQDIVVNNFIQAVETSRLGLSTKIGVDDIKLVDTEFGGRNEAVVVATFTKDGLNLTMDEVVRDIGAGTDGSDYVRGVTKFTMDHLEDIKRLFPLQATDNLNVRRVQGPSARFESVKLNPKPLDSLTDPVDITLVLGRDGIARERQPGAAKDRQDTHFPDRKGHMPDDVLVFVRGSMERLKTGEKVFHVYELQSDWIPVQAAMERAKFNEVKFFDAVALDSDPVLMRRGKNYGELTLRHSSFGDHDITVDTTVLDVFHKGNAHHNGMRSSASLDSVDFAPLLKNALSAEETVGYHNAMVSTAKKHGVMSKMSLEHMKKKREPLLNYGYEMALKAATRHALDSGASHIAISDSATVMMTERHHEYGKLDFKGALSDDGIAAVSKVLTEAYGKQHVTSAGNLKHRLVMGDTLKEALGGTSLGGTSVPLFGPEGVYALLLSDPRTRPILGVQIEQMEGMRKFYDKDYPKMLKTLTQSTPFPASFGTHRNSSTGVSINGAGEPQTQIKALVFELGNLKARLLDDPRFSISNKKFSEESPLAGLQDDAIIDNVTAQKQASDGAPIDPDVVPSDKMNMRAATRTRSAALGMPMFRSTLDRMIIDQGRTGEHIAGSFRAVFDTSERYFGRFGNKALTILDTIGEKSHSRIMAHGEAIFEHGVSDIVLTPAENKVYKGLLAMFKDARIEQNTSGPMVREQVDPNVDPITKYGHLFPEDFNDPNKSRNVGSRDVNEAGDTYFYNPDGTVWGMHLDRNPKVFFRQGKIELNYWPVAMPKIDVIDTLVNHANTTKAKKLKSEYINHHIKNNKSGKPYGVTEVDGKKVGGKLQEAEDAYDQYFAQMKGNGTVRFSALRTQSGTSLPPSWREDVLGRSLTRYYKKFAMDMAYFQHIEEDPIARGILNRPDQFNDTSQNSHGFEDGELFDPIHNSADVKFTLDTIEKNFSKEDIFIDAANRLVKSTMMQLLTGSKDVVSAPFLIFPNIPLRNLPGLLKTLGSRKAINEGIQRGLDQGVISKNTSSNQEIAVSGEDGVGINSTLTEWFSSMANFMYKWSGREYLEKVARGITMQAGYIAAMDNMQRALNGDKSAIQFFHDMGPRVPEANDMHWEKLIRAGADGRQELAMEVGANLVRTTQGTYDVRGLPKWAIRGKISPFVSLAKWNFERSNNFAKTVVAPLTERGDPVPLLKATIGIFMGGAAVEYVSEKLSKRRGTTPKWSELRNAPDATLGDYTYRLMGLASMSGQAGVVSELLKTGQDFTNRNNAQGFEFQLYEFGVDFLTKVRHMTEALDEGEPLVSVLPAFITEMATGNIQNIRLLTARMDMISNSEFAKRAQDKLRRGEQRKQLKIFENLTDAPQRGFQMVRANPFLNKDLREFKRTADMPKAVGLLRDKILPRVLDETRGQPIERLRKRLAGIRASDRVSVPNPDMEPVKFRNYMEFLSNTQGPDVATGLVQKLQQTRAMNKAKNQMIPKL